ncbi:hypothetical protein CONPUDRAFT_96839, partial [Coniophora puteana RWD-64-598 SS2]
MPRCTCGCNQDLSTSQISRHLKGKSRPHTHVAASTSASSMKDKIDMLMGLKPMDTESSSFPAPAPTNPADNQLGDHSTTSKEPHEPPPDVELPLPDTPEPVPMSDIVHEALNAAREGLRTRSRYAAYVEEVDEDEPELSNAQADAEDEADASAGQDEQDLEDDSGTEQDFITGLSPLDALGESFERELAGLANQISDADLHILRVFALKVHGQVTDRVYHMLPRVFPETPTPSIYRTRRQVAALSGVTPILYDCCVDNCCCFTGPYADLETCPYCKKPRRDWWGKPQCQYTYIPLIHRLVSLFRNAEAVETMRYRSERLSMPNVVSDIFDGQHYKNLLQTRVTVHDHEQPHNFFSDPRDIALGMATDGFAPFRRRKTT